MQLRLKVVAIVALAVAYAWPMQVTGWNQNSHWALVRALADGVPYIDETLGEIGDLGSGDIAHHEGHTYTVKPPGLALETVPWYLVVRSTGMRTAGEPTRPVWAINLWGSVLPAILLVLTFWWLANQIEPGYGLLAAIIVGLGTMVLSFATLYFNHSLASLLGFAPFALLFRERAGPPRTRLVALAGVLVGLGTCVDYQLAFGVGVVLGLYALRTRRVRDALVRGAVYAAGVALGAVPSLLFNRWAFGSFTHNVYEDYWREHPGLKATLNPYAVAPDWHTVTAMLFSSMGLFTLAPVLLLGIAGVVLLYRRGRRAEALVVVGVCLVIGLYQAGLGGFGGQGPPRYLTPLVPYLALPIVLVLRAAPLTTLALAAISIFQTAVQAATGPLAAYDGDWLARVGDKVFVQTAASLVDVTGWYTIAVYFLAVLVALVAALLATVRPAFAGRELPVAAAAILLWAVIALRAWNPVGKTPSDTYIAAAVVGAACAAGVAAAVLRSRTVSAS
jgi:hypothetical protein